MERQGIETLLKDKEEVRLDIVTGKGVKGLVLSGISPEKVKKSVELQKRFRSGSPENGPRK